MKLNLALTDENVRVAVPKCTDTRCAYIYMYICVYIHAYIFTLCVYIYKIYRYFLYTYTYMCSMYEYINNYVSMCMSSCIPARIQRGGIHACACMYVIMYVCMHVRMHVRTCYACACACACMHLGCKSVCMYVRRQEAR